MPTKIALEYLGENMLKAIHNSTSRKAYFVLIAAALVSGCGDGDGPATKIAKEKIVARLSDPQSVQYRNVVEYQGGVVCGEYNAKNRMGGYVGFEGFIFAGPTPGDITFKPQPYETSVWCKQESLESKKKEQDEFDKEASSCGSYDSNCRDEAALAVMVRRIKRLEESSAQLEKARSEKK